MTRAADVAGRPALWIAYLLTRCGIVLQLLCLPIKDTDLNLYYDYAVNAQQGKLPYRDFSVEYPPLAYLVIRAALPACSTHSQEHLKAGYVYRFRTFMLLADLVSFLLLLSLVRTHPAGMQRLCVGGYLMSTMFLSTLIFDRLDALLATLLLLWLLGWSRALAHRHLSPWALIACAALGLGIAYKLIPVIVVPVVAVVELLNRSSRGRLLGGGTILAGSASIPFAAAHILIGNAVWDFLGYHARRGIQIESLHAAILMLVGLFGGQVEAQHDFGSWNVSGTGSAWLMPLSTVLVLGFAAVIVVLVWMRRRLLLEAAERQRIAIAAGCLTIGGAVIFSKVFSPQYLVWAFALLLVAGLQLLPSGRYRLYVLGWCVTATLTALIWPATYARLIKDFWLPAQICVIARNGLFLFLMLWATMALARLGHRRRKSCHNDGGRG